MKKAEKNFPQGCFITFEGGEGAGKSTLIKRIYQYLVKKKYDVLLTKAPGGTNLGKKVRSFLLEQKKASISPRGELFLFLADRAQHIDEIILPALKKRQIVLCDRFNDSTIAYQGAGRGFSKKWLISLLKFATNGLQPDLTFYLDVKPEIGFLRVQKAKRKQDRLEQETLAFHKKVRKAFLDIARNESKRVYTIDASVAPDVVFAHAKCTLDAFLQPSRK